MQIFRLNREIRTGVVPDHQPTEDEPNDPIDRANSFTLPSAEHGACGFALEANTQLALENAGGGVLASNDDINAATLNYCSRITATLTPGVYYVAVTGWTSGRYRLTTRVGP